MPPVNSLPSTESLLTTLPQLSASANPNTFSHCSALTTALYLCAVALGSQSLDQVINDPVRGLQAAAQPQHVAVQGTHSVLRGGAMKRGGGVTIAA